MDLINPFLPHQLVIDFILTRLPTKFVIQCSCVCKVWYSLILCDPHFASLQFSQYSQKRSCFLYQLNGEDGINSFYMSSPEEESDAEYVDLRKISMMGNNDQRKLIGSCNGLVCLYNLDSKMIEVCNPTRRQTLCIHPPHSIIISADQRSQYGFGYDPILEEYKFVRVLFEISKCQVLSLGKIKSDWVEIPFGNNFISKLSEDDPSQSRRTNFFNEFIQRRGPTFYDKCFWWIHGKELLSLNLDQKNFQAIKLPPESVRGFSLMLLVHREKLCCAKFNAICTGTVRWNMDLFILEMQDKEYIWRNEQIRLPFISPGHSVQLVDFNNELVQHQVLGGGCIMTYNLHTRKLKNVRKLVRDNLYDQRDTLSENLVGYANRNNWATNTHVENFISLQTFVCQGIMVLQQHSCRAFAFSTNIFQGESFK